VATTVKRKTTIRTAEALRAGMGAFGIAEGDGHGTTLTISEDGATASLESGKLPGTSATPAAFDLISAAVVYPAESDAAVCDLLAWATAEQIKEVASREGHAAAATEETVRGRGVIRIVVEQPPKRMTFEIDRGGREFIVSNQGFSNPREGRAFSRPYNAIFA